jgi:hypothetical protein
MFHPSVAYVSHICCKCFYLDVVYVFAIATHVSFLVFYVCCNCFNLFLTYVASVSSRYCKSRSSVIHVVVGPICSSHLLQLLGPPACVWVWKGCHDAATRHGAARATMRAQDMVRREPTREAGAGVQTLDLPFLFRMLPGGAILVESSLILLLLQYGVIQM